MKSVTGHCVSVLSFTFGLCTDTFTVVAAVSRCRFLIIHCETDGEQGDVSEA